VKKLEELGVKRLLVEGGGGLMWDFVKPNLIDELYVTLTPRILGGRDAPTLVDGAGFNPREVVNLKLKQCRRVGDELYLVYKKTSRRGP
jgi:2,5-diamino-6-(ribosylamino)-4(3H)-pyrimidinone 5'-phosphate reductase